MRNLLVLVTLLTSQALLAGHGYGPTPEELASKFERVLVPIFIPAIVGGAGGSLWQSDLWVYNDSEHEVEVIPNVWFIAPIPERSTVPPKTVTGLRMFGYPPMTANIHRAVPARLVFVDKAHSDSIFFNAYLIGPGTSKTSVPVVREPNFRTNAVHVVGVPVPQRSRLTIRVYEPDVQPSTSVVVRVRTLSTSPPLFEQVLDLATIPSECCFAHVPSYPNYGQLTLHPDVFSGVQGRLEIEVRSLQQGRRLWALVSATDNDTQDVKLYWPN